MIETLLLNGLPLVAGIVKEKGVDLAQNFLNDTLGIDIDLKGDKLEPEALKVLKTYEDELNEYYGEIDRLRAEIRDNTDFELHKILTEELKEIRDNLSSFELTYA